MDTLFDLDGPLSADCGKLRERLRELASQGVRIGGSSWKYEGWLDQIYTRSRYLSRGKFSKKLFEETCIAEYAEVFPAVCGDFAFYQFPSEPMWAKLFRQTGPEFRWCFKAPEQITVPCFPMQPRYGAVAGLPNPTFLDARLFEQSFTSLLGPYRGQTGLLIFEFGTFRQRTFESARQFVHALDPFLDRLPAGWPYAVEIRNADFLTPEYFDCLRAHGIAHVYNAWTRMPELADQIAIPKSRTTDMIVTRALLRKGRPYEEAVRLFSPYTEVRDVNPDVRGALREIIDMAVVDGVPAFIFVNNRLEGNSPATIVAITD